MEKEDAEAAPEAAPVAAQVEYGENGAPMSENAKRFAPIKARLLSELRKRGIRCRLYVPFANSWGLAVQYLRRRLDEYPAMMWLVTKNLLRLG